MPAQTFWCESRHLLHTTTIDNQFHRGSTEAFMEQRNKLLAALAPVVLLAGWAITHEVLVILHECAAARAEKERRMAEINSVKSFAASTNAIVDWQKTLCNGDTGTHLFSTDLETVLVRPDGHGMMFYGELKDILHSNDNSDVAVFRAHGCFDTKLELRLTASPEVVQKLQASRSQAIPYFVMSATITGVSKPGRPTAGSTAVSSDEWGDVIVVKGRIFDVLYIGPDGYQFELGRGDLPSS
jgi:hypothetical protein